MQLFIFLFIIAHYNNNIYIITFIIQLQLIIINFAYIIKS